MDTPFSDELILRSFCSLYSASQKSLLGDIFAPCWLWSAQVQGLLRRSYLGVCLSIVKKFHAFFLNAVESSLYLRELRLEILSSIIRHEKFPCSFLKLSGVVEALFSIKIL